VPPLIIIIIIIIIEFFQINSIDLRANLTVQKPITKRPRVEKKKTHIQTKYKNKAIIITIIIIPLTQKSEKENI
jgi:hypothetical protein